MRIEESYISSVRESLRTEVQYVVDAEGSEDLERAAAALDDYELTILWGLCTGHRKCYACQCHFLTWS